jgi:hypothetical protein
MANTVYYNALSGGEGRTLKSRLGTIAGLGSNNEEPGEKVDHNGTVSLP